MNSDEEFEKLLHRLYVIEHNYDGATELYRKAKLQNKYINKLFVSNWLKNRSSYQQNIKQKVGKKEFKPIYSDDPYSFQIDLTFLPKYKSKNNDNYVLFTAINVNSRYAYAYYGKNKETNTIIDMLDKFLKNALIINIITCDSGSEFKNKIVQKWFNDNNIKLFYVVGDSHKLGIINRFHRTLKDKLLLYFTENNTVRWIDIIDKVIYNYNRTKNRGIGYTPLEASNLLIQSEIINNAIEKTNNIIDDEDDFKINDYCRILNNKVLFDKLKTKYSKEIYTIEKITKNSVYVKDVISKIITKHKKDEILIIPKPKTIDTDIIKPEKDIIEKIYKIDRKLKKIDIKSDNIIIDRPKRDINKPSRFND